MRVPLRWLADYVDVELSPEQLAERLTLLGMEVKGLERWGSDWQSVVVGELLTVERHARADRLSLTTVTVGEGEPLHIVCGATNIRPGQRVPVALPGAVLPGGRAIERAEKMGVVSEGMLCSGDELRVTTDAEGILILPPATPLGRSLQELYGDTVLDVDVKPNRGDALSLLGLAREVAAVTGGRVRWPEIALEERGRPAEERFAVEVREPELCTRFVGRWIDGVRVGPAPDEVQMRLQAAGMRPISNVVDASNYVMLEMGKPTHTFDASAVRGGRIIVRLAGPGERLETLDHVDRALDPETLLIADPEGPIGIAGVMGGAASEVGDGTTAVIVESAVFDPVSIRRTGQRYALRSEASLRFEKGQEVRLARLGADRVAQLVAAWAGGEVAPGRVDTAPQEPDRARLAFRPSRVNRLLGTAIPTAEQRALLARVEIETLDGDRGAPIPVSAGSKPLVLEGHADETVVALVPTWRRDLLIEADVAEEVARVRGYELVDASRPDTLMPAYRPSPLGLRDFVRETLAGAGLDEVVTHALVAPGSDPLLAWPDDTSEPAVELGERAGGDAITVRNPLSQQHSVLRRHLGASLLDLLAGNERRGRSDVAIFEIGKGYARGGGSARDGGSARGDEDAREWWRLGYLVTGQADPPSWSRVPRTYDLDDAKGIVELLARRLGAAAPTYTADRRGYPFHPGRAVRVVARGSGAPDASPVAIAGRIAELHPDLLEKWEIRAERVFLAELAIAGLEAGRPRVVRATPISHQPGIERDVAVVVREDQEAASVLATIRDAAGPLLRDVTLFDVYRGAPLAGGEKSLACRLEFQALDRTLTETEVESAVGSVTAALAERLGARLRT